MCVFFHSVAVHGGSLHSTPHHQSPEWRERAVGGREGQRKHNTAPLWSHAVITTCYWPASVTLGLSCVEEDMLIGAEAYFNPARG